MPENVFVYRDGASFGQYDVVREFEVPQVKNALKKVKDQDGKV